MIQQRFLRLSAVIAVAIIASCNVGMPELTLAASPTTLDPNGKKARITATATRFDGNIGTGSVRFTADVGTLTDETVPLDEFGSATTTYSCDRATNPDCTDRATITARWMTEKMTVTETLSIRLATNTGGLDGGMTGGGGGAAGPGSAMPIGRFCGNPARPGLAECCRNSMVATSGDVFPCPATRVPAGAEVDVPFKSAAGTMASVRLKWSAPFRPASLAECQAMAPTLIVSDMAVFSGGASYSIQSTGFWMSVGAPDICALAFAPGNTGAVRVVSNGSFNRAGESFTQVDNTAFFLLLERG